MGLAMGKHVQWPAEQQLLHRLGDVSRAQAAPEEATIPVREAATQPCVPDGRGRIAPLGVVDHLQIFTVVGVGEGYGGYGVREIAPLDAPGRDDQLVLDAVAPAIGVSASQRHLGVATHGGCRRTDTVEDGAEMDDGDLPLVQQMLQDGPIEGGILRQIGLGSRDVDAILGDRTARTGETQRELCAPEGCHAALLHLDGWQQQALDGAGASARRGR